MDTRSVYDQGIYHSLPVIDPSITNLTAIITGANGVSGFHTLRALLLLCGCENIAKIVRFRPQVTPQDLDARITGVCLRKEWEGVGEVAATLVDVRVERACQHGALVLRQDRRAVH